MNDLRDVPSGPRVSHAERGTERKLADIATLIRGLARHFPLILRKQLKVSTLDKELRDKLVVDIDTFCKRTFILAISMHVRSLSHVAEQLAVTNANSPSALRNFAEKMQRDVLSCASTIVTEEDLMRTSALPQPKTGAENDAVAFKNSLLFLQGTLGYFISDANYTAAFMRDSESMSMNERQDELWNGLSQCSSVMYKSSMELVESILQHSSAADLPSAVRSEFVLAFSARTHELFGTEQGE